LIEGELQLMSETFERLERINVDGLDEILGKPIKVLDDGFVRVIDYMGCDTSIVQAARVSYGKGTKKISRDRGLIRYLMQHYHTTPFEMCEIKFHLRIPMDCWRQWIRHRTASVNEYSTRYSIAIDSAQETTADAWRLQTRSNKQGSSGFIDIAQGETFSKKEKEFHDLARSLYEERLQAGVAREQARKDLPLSTYTEAYWKIDLHNLLHFLHLRMEEHAQYEIRCYARTIGEEIVKRWCPLAWEAFMDYRYNATYFSVMEIELMQALSSGNEREAIDKAESYGWLTERDGNLTGNLECLEFEEKARRLGIKIPWKKK
jgi:thymidylate synthase (FAD)